MITIRYVTNEDKRFWFELDKHLPEAEFEKKVRDRQGYVLFEDNEPVGILRYNLFWDNTPFCTITKIRKARQNDAKISSSLTSWRFKKSVYIFQKTKRRSFCNKYISYPT